MATIILVVKIASSSSNGPTSIRHRRLWTSIFFSVWIGPITSLPGQEQDGEENESSMIDESTWEQLVIRALANPTEWVQLRQALGMYCTTLTPSCVFVRHVLVNFLSRYYDRAL